MELTYMNITIRHTSYLNKNNNVPVIVIIIIYVTRTYTKSQKTLIIRVGIIIISVMPTYRPC